MPLMNNTNASNASVMGGRDAALRRPVGAARRPYQSNSTRHRRITNAMDNGGSSKAEAGLWIDHREAFVVVLSKTGEETKRIQSSAETQPRRSGEPSGGRFEYQAVPADDSRQREYTGHLARYYDEIISFLHEAGAILIFGPGEAKGELKRRFEMDKTGARLVTLETADKMTEPQITAHVRHHFHPEAAR